MGTWRNLKHELEGVSMTMAVLTDGTVCVAVPLVDGFSWWRLHPDEIGDYANGSWTPMATLDGKPATFPKVLVLKDGRLLVWLVEGPNVASLYDPVMDSWQNVPAPPKWYDEYYQILVRATCVLRDGRVLCRSAPDGNKSTPTDGATWILDPAALKWTRIEDKLGDADVLDRETWTLLPDGSVLSVQWHKHRALRFLGDHWEVLAEPPAALFSYYPKPSSSSRVGVSLLLGNGNVMVSGSNGATAFYTPPATYGSLGSWAIAPSLPSGAGGSVQELIDGGLCLLRNGNVLCHAEGADAHPVLFEFDGTAFWKVELPPDFTNGSPAMIPLPSGEILLSEGSWARWLYQPAGADSPNLKPIIDSAPSSLIRGETAVLLGRRLAGAAVGVHLVGHSANTNFPIVRLKSATTARVYYCRTFNHSLMGVHTGDMVLSTLFEVPAYVPEGKYKLCVVTHGVSDCVDVAVWKGWKQPVVTVPGKMPGFTAVIAGGGIEFGGLDDGPIWVIGPRGVIGHGPGWSPDVRAEAEAGHDLIRRGVAVLVDVGHKLTAAREQAQHHPVPPLVFPRQRR